MKKIIVLILIFYFLVVFQTSFLAHFKTLSFLPSLGIIFLIFLNIFEKPQEKTALITSLVSGFILDAFSSKPFGFYALLFLLISLIIKLIIKKYLRLEFDSKKELR
jgi:rod shape-determining protein MreD